MSKKALLLTVGGSFQPIVTSIKRNQPDYIVFFCSDDTEKVPGSYITVDDAGMENNPFTKTDSPSIVRQTNLTKEQYEIVKIKEFDNHNICYEIIFNKIIELQRNDFKDIVGDYTGGTKSMSGGLLLAFSDFPDLIFSVVSGERNDLIKVSDGSQRVIKTRINLPLFNSTKKYIVELGSKFEYKAALNMLDQLEATPDLSIEQYSLLKELRLRYNILNEWDSFNHEKAYSLLEKNDTFSNSIRTQLLYVLNSRRCLVDNKKIPPSSSFHRYELIYDLILNVKRKQAQSKYEDAIGRLYRALELLAQARLKLEYNIITSDIDTKNVPETIKSSLEHKKDSSGKIRVGLVDAYDLLTELKDCVIAENFKKDRSIILRQLEKRNFSILAHGFNSISESEFSECYEVLAENFILKALKKIAGEENSFPEQLPS